MRARKTGLFQCGAARNCTDLARYVQYRLACIQIARYFCTKSRSDWAVYQVLFPTKSRQSIMVTIQSRKRRRAALKQLTARDIMTASPKSLRPTTTARSADRFVRTHGIPSAPVINSAGHLIGIVSEADLFDLWGRTDRLSDAVCNKTRAGINANHFWMPRRVGEYRASFYAVKLRQKS
jgi:hypothetical protein